ncbi:MAG TPA: glycogen synthase GlgA [Holophagaceae bacterium]|nr:glycogen synthase GlgA [Holophagaceae bacterium]
MRILHVATELFPLFKVGGLGDVLAGLPLAQATQGEDVRILLPGLAALGPLVVDLERLHWPGLPRALGRGRSPAGLPLYLLDIPSPYSAEGPAYRDQAEGAADLGLLAQVATRLALEGDGQGWRPEVVHAHDWPTGLVPAQLAQVRGPRPRTVFTIHNAAHQGLYPRRTFPSLGLPPEADTPEGVEFYGQVSFIKAGVRYADKLTTVSPTYRQELLRAGEGMGLEGLLQARSADFIGILNGVDAATWDPRTDAALALPFDEGSLGLRAVNKRALQRELGLEEDESVPLAAVVSRLDVQKGLDLVQANAESILARGAQLAVLGVGDPELEASFRSLSVRHSGRIAFARTHDEDLAHRFFGAADFVLLPSRFEPCGLTQLYAMRYGALPIARCTGGLADTVVDPEFGRPAAGPPTGFVFTEPTAEALGGALERAFRVREEIPEQLEALQRGAMARDSGWAVPARAYGALYRTAMDPP